MCLFFELLLLPFAQKVVKADDTVICFVLFNIRLAEKSSCCSRGFKSPPLSCDSANSWSNPGLKPGFLLVLSCRGWISPRQANEQKLIYLCMWWGGNLLHSLPTSSCKMLALFRTSHFGSWMKRSEQQRSRAVGAAGVNSPPWLCCTPRKHSLSSHLSYTEKQKPPARTFLQQTSGALSERQG